MKNQKEVILKKLNANEDIPIHSVVGFIGKRKTGKSTLIKDVMFKFRHALDWGVVMCATEEAEPFYKEFVPDCFCHTAWKPELIADMIKDQEAHKLSGSTIRRNAFVVIDDCNYEKSMWRDTVMRNLMMNGRHFNITVFVSSQYLMDIEISLRSNIDFLFVLRDNNVQNMKKLYSNYFGNVESFQAFRSIMKSCTEDRNCLVLDCCSSSNELDKTLFYYKAKIHNLFYVGNENFWKTAKSIYNPFYKSKELEKNSFKGRRAILAPIASDQKVIGI